MGKAAKAKAKPAAKSTSEDIQLCREAVDAVSTAIATLRKKGVWPQKATSAEDCSFKGIERFPNNWSGKKLCQSQVKEAGWVSSSSHAICSVWQSYGSCEQAHYLGMLSDLDLTAGHCWSSKAELDTSVDYWFSKGREPTLPFLSVMCDESSVRHGVLQS